mgnify:FL=1
MNKLILLPFLSLFFSRSSFCYELNPENNTNVIENNSTINKILSPVLNANTSDRLTYALLSERTVSSENKFTQVPELLINISSVIYNTNDLQANDAFVVLENFIKAGATGFAVDIEYNQSTNEWGVYNQNSLMTFDFILGVLSNFSVDKMNLSNLRIMHVLLNIIDKEKINNLEEKLQLIQNSIESKIGLNRVLTINSINSQSGWPTPVEIILYDYRQFIFHYVNVETDSTKAVMSGKYIDVVYDSSQNFSCPLQIDNSTTTLTYRNSEVFTSTNINEAIYCGYKVIISNPFENFNETINALNSSLVWGWGKNEPTISSINFGEYEGFSSSFGGGYYMGCAILNATNVFDIQSNSSLVDVKNFLWWNVSNCYENKPALCRYPGDTDTWFISNKQVNYFLLRADSTENAENNGCPEGTYFTVPKTPKEMLSAYRFIKQLDNQTLIDIVKEKGIWIELNSVSLSTCWVVGDYKTKCPYQQFINKRNFFRMVLPLIISGGCLMLAIFMLKFRRLPVQNDNKQWKKFIKEFANKSDPDGVPY